MKNQRFEFSIKTPIMLQVTIFEPATTTKNNYVYWLNNVNNFSPLHEK